MADGGYSTTLITILLVLGLMAIFVPMLQDAVGVTSSTYDVPTSGNVSLIEEYNPDTANPELGSAKQMLGSSFVKSLFWYYDWFPIWLTLVHVIIRIVAIYCIYKIVNPFS